MVIRIDSWTFDAGHFDHKTKAWNPRLGTLCVALFTFSRYLLLCCLCMYKTGKFYVICICTYYDGNNNIIFLYNFSLYCIQVVLIFKPCLKSRVLNENTMCKLGPSKKSSASIPIVWGRMLLWLRTKLIYVPVDFTHSSYAANIWSHEMWLRWVQYCKMVITMI